MTPKGDQALYQQTRRSAQEAAALIPSGAKICMALGTGPVSYTHLTLPTKA